MERYQKIHNHIWRDEKFRELSESGQLLYLYLLTSPHSNSIGLYCCPKSYMAADLKWSLRKVSATLDEVLRLTNTDFDENAEIVFIKNHLKHDPIHNDNQAKFAIKALEGLPNTRCLFEAYKALEQYCPPKKEKDGAKRLREWFQERFPKPIPDTIHINSFQNQNKKQSISRACVRESKIIQEDNGGESAQGGGGEVLTFEGQPPPALDSGGRKTEINKKREIDPEVKEILAPILAEKAKRDCPVCQGSGIDPNSRQCECTKPESERTTG